MAKYYYVDEFFDVIELQDYMEVYDRETHRCIKKIRIKDWEPETLDAAFIRIREEMKKKGYTYRHYWTNNAKTI